MKPGKAQGFVQGCSGLCVDTTTSLSHCYAATFVVSTAVEPVPATNHMPPGGNTGPPYGAHPAVVAPATLNRPHYLVFANQPPDESLLSSDRWKVLQLGVDIVVDE